MTQNDRLAHNHLILRGATVFDGIDFLRPR